jgi:hypothetical protein
MNLPEKPADVAHVSDAHWEAALDKAYSTWSNPIRDLAGTWHLSELIDHARCLILLGEVVEPVDPIEAAIIAAAQEAVHLPVSGYHADFASICRKHFAGLCFPAIGEQS